MSGLEVRDLTVRFGDQTVVDALSFAIAPGERLGLIGSSGCGKTMTALAVVGLAPENSTVSGSVLLDGIDLLTLDDAAMSRHRGRRIGTIFQDPMASLDPMMRIGRQIAEPLVVHDLATRDSAMTTAIDWCEKVGFPDPAITARRYPHQLSGGQRQRVGIAAALSASPSLLIADEPTTALDVTVQDEVLTLIENLVRDRDLSLLFITHDVAVAARMTTRLMVMDSGTVVESGPTSAVLGAPHHEVTRALLDAARATAIEPTDDRS